MKTDVYSVKGTKAGSVDLPETLFGQKWNADLVHQVVTSMQSNQRAGTADARGRGDVSGGGKKPWRQKGTGRARHGSTRSPIWVGGGVTHGPNADKDYSRKINKKVKSKALATVLSALYRDGKILFVDSIDMKDAKTKEAFAALKGLTAVKGFETIMTPKKTNALVCFAKPVAARTRAFRNLAMAHATNAKELNVLDLVNHRYLVVVGPEAVAQELLTRPGLSA